MTLFKELSLFPFNVCFKLKGFADNRKLNFNKHIHIQGGEAKRAKCPLLDQYSLCRFPCDLEASFRTRRKREGKGMVQEEGKGMLKGMGMGWVRGKRKGKGMWKGKGDIGKGSGREGEIERVS